MWIVALVIVLVIAAGALTGLLLDAPGRREIKELSIENVNFENLRDGTYIGEYQGSKSHSRNAKVEVTILDGQISDIRILEGALDKDGMPAKLTGGQSIEDLFNEVIDSETLQVDVISGATLTSKAHLKALEIALEQAEIK